MTQEVIWYNGMQLTQDPNDIIGYTFDWANYLKTGEILNAASVSADPGISAVSQSYNNSTNLISISGGVVGTTYKVEVQVTTSAGQQFNRAINVKIQDV